MSDPTSRTVIDKTRIFCIMCKKPYDEKLNFNWSCIVHQGDFNVEDDMWWCCGKNGEKAIGCKR